MFFSVPRTHFTNPSFDHVPFKHFLAFLNFPSHFLLNLRRFFWFVLFSRFFCLSLERAIKCNAPFFLKRKKQNLSTNFLPLFTFVSYCHFFSPFVFFLNGIVQVSNYHDGPPASTLYGSLKSTQTRPPETKEIGLHSCDCSTEQWPNFYPVPSSRV